MSEPIMTWEEVYQYCERHRDEDRFCRVSCSCSGPTFSNLQCDHDDRQEGTVILRGGVHGSCKFVVADDD